MLTVLIYLQSFIEESVILCIGSDKLQFNVEVMVIQ